MKNGVGVNQREQAAISWLRKAELALSKGAPEIVVTVTVKKVDGCVVYGGQIGRPCGISSREVSNATHR